MHHGRHGESQGVTSQREGVTLLDELQLCGLVAEELLHHLSGLGGGDHCC